MTRLCFLSERHNTIHSKRRFARRNLETTHRKILIPWDTQRMILINMWSNSSKSPGDKSTTPWSDANSIYKSQASFGNCFLVTVFLFIVFRLLFWLMYWRVPLGLHGGSATFKKSILCYKAAFSLNATLLKCYKVLPSLRATLCLSSIRDLSVSLYYWSVTPPSLFIGENMICKVICIKASGALRYKKWINYPIGTTKNCWQLVCIQIVLSEPCNNF